MSKIWPIIYLREKREREIDEKEINLNIKNVFEGKPLTCPLADLNKAGFLEKYNQAFDYFNKDKIIEEKKEKKREYENKPEVKEKRKIYSKNYYSKPDVKERRKKNSREYVKREGERIREWHRGYYKKNRDKFSKKQRERYHRHKELGLCVRCLKKAEGGIFCAYHSHKKIND